MLDFILLPFVSAKLTLVLHPSRHPPSDPKYSRHSHHLHSSIFISVYHLHGSRHQVIPLPHRLIHQVIAAHYLNRSISSSTETLKAVHRFHAENHVGSARVERDYHKEFKGDRTRIFKKIVEEDSKAGCLVIYVDNRTMVFV